MATPNAASALLGKVHLLQRFQVHVALQKPRHHIRHDNTVTLPTTRSFSRAWWRDASNEFRDLVDHQEINLLALTQLPHAPQGLCMVPEGDAFAEGGGSAGINRLFDICARRNSGAPH